VSRHLTGPDVFAQSSASREIVVPGPGRGAFDCEGVQLGYEVKGT
jgi:hypothetical protein